MWPRACSSCTRRASRIGAVPLGGRMAVLLAFRRPRKLVARALGMLACVCRPRCALFVPRPVCTPWQMHYFLPTRLRWPAGACRQLWR